jgi:hypothetical protein
MISDQIAKKLFIDLEFHCHDEGQDNSWDHNPRSGGNDTKATGGCIRCTSQKTGCSGRCSGGSTDPGSRASGNTGSSGTLSSFKK